MPKSKTEVEVELQNTPTLDELLSQIERSAEQFDATEWQLMSEFCAKWVLDQVGKLDPRWARLIEAAKIETRRDDWKLLGSWIARVLERGDHISASPHPFFEDGGGRLTEKACEECHTKFLPEIHGQRFHSNECGTAAFNREREKKIAEETERERIRKATAA